MKKKISTKKFFRNGKECYLDPIRQKLIYATPEEKVRQETICHIVDMLKVPIELIEVEQHLSHYGIESNKRADIVIHKINENNEMKVVAIIECKAPEVHLDIKAKEQMLEYCDLTYADFAMMTNGNYSMCFAYDDNKKDYVLIDELPSYVDMCKGKFLEWDIGDLPERIPFDNLQTFLREEFNSCGDDEYGMDISKLTPIDIAVPIFNLWEGLLDTRIKMPAGDYGLFKLIEDYGVRMVSYGNASGGTFYGPYRSFLVQIDDNAEIFSIAISTYSKSTNPTNVKTCINVAHDDEKESHHALQLVVDENIVVRGEQVDFYHHGRIAIGNIGSGKIDELRSFVKERYPQIVLDKKFYLGRAVHNRLWRLDDPEIINLIVNLISYAIIRDEYRAYVKDNKKSNL